VIQEELPPLMELISEDILSKKCHINPAHLILLATLGPGVYSASNRNHYQNQKNNVSEE
jgi:hypothetical protein